MFEQYTERARRVFFFARYEAITFGSKQTETEHLLLGLTREDPFLFCWALGRKMNGHEATAVTDQIRLVVERRATRNAKLPASVDLPLSEQCKQIVKLAKAESERLNHRHIGTEHLFLALLKLQVCLGASVLGEIGITWSEVDKLIPRANPVSQGSSIDEKMVHHLDMINLMLEDGVPKEELAYVHERLKMLVAKVEQGLNPS